MEVDGVRDDGERIFRTEIGGRQDKGFEAKFCHGFFFKISPAPPTSWECGGRNGASDFGGYAPPRPLVTWKTAERMEMAMKPTTPATRKMSIGSSAAVKMRMWRSISLS